MRRFICGAPVLAVLLFSGWVAGEAKQAVETKLAPLERFAGEWLVEGKWSNGESLQARSVYEWGLGKKIMRAKTFVKNGDKEYQRYEGILAWQPEKKSLFEISFAFDGQMTEVLIESKDKDTLHIGWAPYREGKPSPVRQTIRFLDNDRFQWVVSLKEGEEWKEIMDATWKRKAK
jgi:hypothetical protein